MYLIYIPTVNSNIKKVKYADDTVIVELLPDNQQSQLQMVADIVNNWCSDDDLILNAKKRNDYAKC